MILKATDLFSLFEGVINDYHIKDHVDTELNNPKKGFEHLLYQKNWVDAVQWHLEDIVRDEHIEPSIALAIKRRIDKSNQLRTDLVEQIDDELLKRLPNQNAQAPLNTESPAWVIDRISILCLKIYHMQEQLDRKDVDTLHLEKCTVKLNTLLEQKRDLVGSFDTLMLEIANGTRRVKVYRQIKMYNDKTLNPALYGK